MHSGDPGQSQLPEPVLAQKPEAQFQKGLIKEEGEGALLEAIEIYNEVAGDESAERSLQAKALLHVGLCYEKLGKQEAKKTYQKIINQFPEQTGTVKVAKEKLSRMAQTGSSAVMRVSGNLTSGKYGKVPHWNI